MSYEEYLDNPGFDDWGEGFQEAFEALPGISYFRDYEYERAEGMFYEGWVDRDASPDDRHDAREDFFEYTGLTMEDFPWDEWREAMGYD